MAKYVYCLKKRQDTEEKHLFKAVSNDDGTCSPENESICKKMNLKQKNEKVFSCKTEIDARLECAKIGRTVCGTCVSHLYESYD
jgi:hypothetical protein